MYLTNIYHTSRLLNPYRKIICHSSLSFVPKHDQVSDTDITRIRNFLTTHKNIVVLTGAGISTESGIPDYRSEDVGLYARSSSRPIQFQQFVKSSNTRQRYWARNYVGWPRFSSFQPNINHFALQKLEINLKKINSIVTQNVDELHRKAGSENVIELHGSAHRVRCLQCSYTIQRHLFQKILYNLNPSVVAVPESVRPDGDVDLPQDIVDNFLVPNCPLCHGILKPDIVFFGDNVPTQRVNTIKELVQECDALLVLGSSLMVFSGYRFILQASELGKEIAIINIGKTRGDKYAQVKIEKRCGEVFSQLLEEKFL